jgi:hypothetical protein
MATVRGPLNFKAGEPMPARVMAIIRQQGLVSSLADSRGLSRGSNADLPLQSMAEHRAWRRQRGKPSR